MHDVFISYSHKDKYIADGMCANLEANSIRCWYAPRDIKPGDEWSEAIMDALKEAKVFVLIFSKNSNHSDQVYNEITSALQFGCHIIPFCVDSVEMEKRLAYYLNAVHWLDATDNSLLDNIEKLYEEVYRQVKSAAPKKFIRVPFTNREKYIRNIKIAVSAVVFIAFLAFFVMLFHNGGTVTEKYSAKVGDIIEFGSMDSEPIEWKVIDKEGDRILVISREGLFSSFYNMYGGICTWESCTLRSKLNSEYYDLWFTQEEKNNIFETHLENPGNTLYGTEGGHPTRDRLFILSVDEVIKYLPEQSDRKLMGAGYLGHSTTTYKPWWVRNPGENLDCAVYVDDNGDVGYEIGINMEMGVGTASAGAFLVRPAMWIKYDGPAEKESSVTQKIDYSSLKAAEQGDTVQFGRYEQDNNNQNGKEIIDWIVLEATDYNNIKNLTLISKVCLDSVNITSLNYGGNFWYDSVARSWLNEQFYTDAFNAEEREMIQPVLVQSGDTSMKLVKTSDNVVLLSMEQLDEFSHILSVTAFSVSTYAYENALNKSGEWWLIDTCPEDDFNYVVNSQGETDREMQKFFQYVRPVINIQINEE